MLWSCGGVVIWREAWRGTTYHAVPVRVVEDSERRFVFHLAEGTYFPAGSWPFADEHPWAKKGAWRGHGLLVQHRPGDAHTIWHFWRGEEREFAGWYVNMQEPLERDGPAFDTQDHELDIWIEPDGTWRWKDKAEREEWVQRGRLTRAEVWRSERKAGLLGVPGRASRVSAACAPPT